jgi:hypothetical protein
MPEGELGDLHEARHQPAGAGHHVLRRQLDDGQRDGGAWQERRKGCRQRAQAVDADMPTGVEGEHDECDEKRTDGRQHVADGLAPSAQHGQRPDKQAQRCRADETPRRWLENQCKPGALHRVSEDGDPHRKSPLLVANSVDFGHSLVRRDRPGRRTRHQLGQREGLVVPHVEVWVGDIEVVTGRAADLDVVGQGQQLHVEAVGARRRGHRMPDHGHRVVGRGHGGTEGSHELVRRRVALVLLGWHGRRLLRGVP